MADKDDSPNTAETDTRRQRQSAANQKNKTVYRCKEQYRERKQGTRPENKTDDLTKQTNKAYEGAKTHRKSNKINQEVNSKH